MSGNEAPAGDEAPQGLPADPTVVRSRRTRSIGFQAALDVLGGEGGADQPQPWTPAGFAIERDRQIALLSDWATDENLWLLAAELGQRNSGRMEHAVLGERSPGTFVFKATKGPKFGFWPHLDETVVSSWLDEFLVMRPATPMQYLSRLQRLEQLSPGLNWLQGFAMLGGKFSIITSQPWYAARNVTWAEIKRWMDERGFIPVRSDVYDDPTRWYHPEQNLALFDVGESNVIHSDGELVPIDIIPMQPDGALLDFLSDFAERNAPNRATP